MFKAAQQKLRQVSAVISGWLGAYASLQGDRDALKGWRPRPATATQAIVLSFTTLVAQCRHLERTTPWGRSVSEGLSADLIGTGVDVLPNTGSDDLDAAIIEKFHEWADHAMVDGSSLWAWQSMTPRELATAGNMLARWVILPERVKNGWLPLAILPLEAEWVSETSVAPIAPNNRFIRGLEVDSLGRTQFFHMRNPETLNFYQGERVPAGEIIHCFERRRSQQIFGEPILAPAVERILQDDRLVRSELQGSVNASAPALAITSEFHPGMADSDGEPVTDIPTGATVRLLPGEDVKAISPTRPNERLAPFRGSIRGDVAGACRVSQENLDRDSSRANYSSMRSTAQLTDRLQASLRNEVGRCVASIPYEKVFDWLLLALGMKLPETQADRVRMMRHEIQPDVRPYVEPVKDGQAAINAVADNMSTLQIECAARGRNYRAIIRQRALENELLIKAGLPVPTPKTSMPVEKDQVEPANQIDKPDVDADDETEVAA